MGRVSLKIVDIKKRYPNLRLIRIAASILRFSTYSLVTLFTLVKEKE